MKNLCFVMATIGVFAATSAQAAGPAFHGLGRKSHVATGVYEAGEVRDG
jgi:hypothetical protein